MTVSFVGAASAESTSLTLPTHQAGDLLIMFAWNGGSLTVPTVPSGWDIVRRFSRSGGANRAGVVAFRSATAAGTASGTWTSSALLGCVVYRDDTTHITIGSDALTQDINSTAFAYAGFAASDGIGTVAKLRKSASWVIGIGGANSNTQALETPPDQMTNRLSRAGASANEIAIHDTAAAVSSYAGGNTTLAATTVGSSITLEVFDTGIMKSAAGMLVHPGMGGGMRG
jgi:hypothetical protein